MSEENKVTIEEKECKCFCKSEGFRKFVIISAGTFTGVFLALSLFAALHKPPMMPYLAPFGHCGRPCPSQQMLPFDRNGHFERGDFHQGKFEKRIPKDFGKHAPFDGAPKPAND